MAASVRSEIVAILDKAQTSNVHHAKLMKTLQILHDKTELGLFVDELLAPLRAALVVIRKEPTVDRVLDFVAKFAASVAPLEEKSEEEIEEEEEDKEGGVSNESPPGGEEEEDEEEGKEEKEEEKDDVESTGESYVESGTDEEEEEMEENFFNLLLMNVLDFHTASNRAIRFRSCQLVSKMLNHGVERGCRIQSCVLGVVRHVMMERIRDKIPIVRVHAVQALELLQEDVSLLGELVRIMTHDPSPDVRRAALKTIAITDHTLTAVIDRTRDVKEMIRKEAYWILAEKCSIRNLRIEQRIRLLEDGLNDRSEIVKEACFKGLLYSWSATVNGDLLYLLSKLDVESSSQVAEQALSKLMDEIDVNVVVKATLGLMDPSNRLESWDDEGGGGGGERVEMAVTERVVPYDLLRSEEAFFWSCVCRYLHKMGDAGYEYMDKVLPSLSDFCTYVQQYVERELMEADGVEEKMQKQFIARQLISIFSVSDLSDEVGRQRLKKMVLDLLVLPGLPLSLVSSLLEHQTTLWPQSHTRVETLLEVIADLQQPLSTTLTTTSSQTSTTLTSEDSQLAPSLNNLTLQDTHVEPDTLARCLMIGTEILKEQKFRKLPVNLKTMVDILVLPSIQNELPDIRELAFGCLGLACLHDISLARNHLLLFLQVSQVDHESVQATAVKVVFDLLLVFGFEAFTAADSGPSPANTNPDNLALDKATCDGGEVTLEEDIDNEVDKEEEEEKEEEEKEGEEEKGEEKEEEEDNKTKQVTQRILTIMANLIDGESPMLREISGEGLAKLMLSGRLISQKLLVRLIVLWVDPATQEEEARLHSVLSLFFPVLAASNRTCRERLREVFQPVLETLSDVPVDSTLRGVNLNKMADYLIQLCAPQEPNEDSVHDTLALSVANGILSESENSALTRVYSYSLTRMQFTSSNKAELLALLDQIQRNVTDKRSLQYIKRVVHGLSKARGGTSEKKTVKEEMEIEEMQETGAESEGEMEEEEEEGEKSDVVNKEEDGTPEVVAEEESADTTLVEPPPSTPPPPPPPPPPAPIATGTKSTVKTKKSTRKTKASTKKSRKKRRFTDSSDEEDDDYGTMNSPGKLESAQLTRVLSCRPAKMSAKQKISKFGEMTTPKSITPRQTRKKKEKEEEERGEESDDSLVGDHSPFVRQPFAKRAGRDRGIPMIFDDDDN